MMITIKGGHVVTGTGIVHADILIENQKIAAVAPEIPAQGQVIDASGLYVMAGVVDPQVHFREPGLTHKEDLRTATRACAAGGVTSYLEMPNTVPNTTTVELMAAKKKLAAVSSIVDYNFFIGATGHNNDDLVKVKNVAGIKIFMGASTGDLLVDDPERLESIFAAGRKLIAVHAEDESMLRAARLKFEGTTDVRDHYRIRSVEAAMSATKLAVSLSKKYNRRLHILHLTSADEAEYLATVKDQNISIEACPQHLEFWGPDIYDETGTLAQMNPPIREKKHSEGLWAALRSGVIDCIATDHSPHTLEEKSRPYPTSPSGMPGVQTALPAILNAASEGRCTYTDVARWMCEMPAHLYRIQNKGFLKPGYDADIVLFDKDREVVIRNEDMFYKVGWTCWHGKKLRGAPLLTICRGTIVYDNRQGQHQVHDDHAGLELQIDEYN